MFFSFLQVLISGATQALDYESVSVDPGHAILPDTTLSPNGDFLYVLSSAKVRFNSSLLILCFPLVTGIVMNAAFVCQ